MLVFSPHVVVHRIGRTGRCGKTGIATTFINKLCGKLPSTCTVITLHFFSPQYLHQKEVKFGQGEMGVREDMSWGSIKVGKESDIF